MAEDELARPGPSPDTAEERASSILRRAIRVIAGKQDDADEGSLPPMPSGCSPSSSHEGRVRVVTFAAREAGLLAPDILGKWIDDLLSPEDSEISHDDADEDLPLYYRHFFAAVACRASSDGPRLARIVLTSPSKAARGAAARWVCTASFGPEEGRIGGGGNADGDGGEGGIGDALPGLSALRDACLGASPVDRTVILTEMARDPKRRRAGLASSLLPVLLGRFGDRVAARILPACNGPAVREFFPQLDHIACARSGLMAARHPEAYLERMEARLGECKGVSGVGVRSRVEVYGNFEAGMATFPPLTFLDLLERFPTDANAFMTVFRPLARICLRREPERTGALLLRMIHQGSSATEILDRVGTDIRRIAPKDMDALALSVRADECMLAKLLRLLAPAARDRVFHSICKSWDEEELASKVFGTDLLLALSAEERDRQVARILRLPKVRDDQELSRTYLALRDIHIGRAEFVELTTAAKADDRKEGWRLLLETIALSSGNGLDEALLSMADSIKNEQEPVRSSVLRVLSSTIKGVVVEDHIPVLDRVFKDALEARDCSPNTHNHIQSIAKDLMVCNAANPSGSLFQFAVCVLKTLLKNPAVGYVDPIPEKFDLVAIPPEAKEELATELLNLVDVLEKKVGYDNEEYNLMKIVRSMGNDGNRVVALQTRINDCVLNKDSSVGGKHWDGYAFGRDVRGYTRKRCWRNSLVDEWLANKRTRDSRVRKLLDHNNMNVLCIAPVLNYLHLIRQEWTDALLCDGKDYGTFYGINAPCVPFEEFTSGFLRWHPRKLRELANKLDPPASDKADKSNNTLAEFRAFRVKRLSNLPITDTKRLAEFLSDQDVVVTEAALHGFSFLDCREAALPYLLENLNSDRARVAMYSITPIVKTLPPDETNKVIRELLNRRIKITVHKEAIRMLGAFATPESTDILRAQCSRKLNRDVRIATGHAARRLLCLGDEGIWDILEELSNLEDPYVAQSLLAASTDEMSPDAQPRYGALLLRLTSHSDHEVRHTAFDTMLRWCRENEASLARRSGDVIVDLEGGRQDWRHAMAAMVGLLPHEDAAKELLSTVKTLTKLPLAPEHDAGPERDRPAQQRLECLVEEHLCQLSPEICCEIKATLTLLADAVSGDPVRFRLEQRLRLNALALAPLDEVGGGIASIAMRPCGDVPYMASLRGRIQSFLSGPHMRLTGEEMDELGSRLARSQEARIRQLSVDVLNKAINVMGKSKERREKLRTLRHDEDEGVRVAACELYTASEL